MKNVYDGVVVLDAKGEAVVVLAAWFGPGTVNIFRNMLGLSEAKYEERRRQDGDEQQKHLEQYPASDPKQRTLSDFIN
jgi:hypothetical protein